MSSIMSLANIDLPSLLYVIWADFFTNKQPVYAANMGTGRSTSIVDLVSVREREREKEQYLLVGEYGWKDRWMNEQTNQ